MPVLLGLTLVVPGCYRGLDGGRPGQGGDDAAGTQGSDAGDTDDGDATGGDGGVPTDAEFSPVVRRLTRIEYANSIADLLGALPQVVATLPPDSRELGFGRIAQAQSVSPLHVEGYAAASTAVADAVIGDDAMLAAVMPCDIASLPARARPVVEQQPGASLKCAPDWVSTRYDSGEQSVYNNAVKTLEATHAFAAAGRHRVTFEGRVELVGDVAPTADVGVRVNGNSVASFQIQGEDYADYAVEIDFAAGTSLINFDLPENLWGEKRIWVRSLTIAGPIDPDAESKAPARRACALGFIDAFAPRAWRRPITADERTSLQGLFDAGVADGYYYDGLRMVIEAILQSPKFLYQIEVGEPVEGRPGYHALDDFAIAARLSYGLWQTTLDDALWDAAESGQLHTPEQITEHAARMLDDDRAVAAIAEFHRQWLRVDELDGATRDVQQFPEFTDALEAEMAEETARLAHEVMWGDRNFAELLTSDRSWIGPELAKLYGVDHPGTGIAEVALPPGRRGLLGHASIATITATAEQTSPVRRGKFVLEQLLCFTPQPPPQGVDATIPPIAPDSTTRERFEQHTSADECAGCHSIIDPIGFAMEDLDAIGRLRDIDNGRPVDAAGGVPLLDVEDGSIVGTAALAGVLADAAQTRACFATQWLRFALGRLDNAADADTLADLAAEVDASSVKAAMLSLVASDAFRHRIVPTKE